ncbi:MAG: D-aminoacyl-tRNA deacylase, partial [Lachnospiraceae bacterium]|nr:D-aminoacyl-tRNA deacylase [Lachnospiraceae bacterium]
MKFVIQRVTEASVEVDHQTVGAIEQGYCVLIGVGKNDSRADAD